MTDKGHEETEKVLKDIENRISDEYAQAEREIAKKLDDYLKKFEVKDELKRKALENGLITEEEYKQWRVGQIMIGQRWAEMRDSLAQDFTNADKIARSIAYDHMPEVYAINHDYGTFQVEKGSQMDTSYTLYDRQAFEKLVKDEDTFIPAPGRKVSRDIKEGKALAWNKKQVQSVMLQGLLQGESIPNLATRLAKSVGESDRKAAIRNARTMTTGVQNAGRVASYDRANDMGIQTQKQWLATLDNRTRHWHASLDGEVADNDQPFQNEYGEIMYPGDPKADPGNIFNCRCTLIASIKGFERDVSDLNLRHDANLKNMSYDEWKAGHYKQESDPITKQDEIAERMRGIYNAEYKIYKNLPDVEVSQQEESKIIFDLKGKDEKFANSKELILKLESQYNTRLQTVTVGAQKAAGDVDMSGATMRLNSNSPEIAIHEFAHTLANSSADKYGLTHDEEFWKEIRKVRTQYHKDVDKTGDTSRWISGYEHSNRSVDEFMCEAFTQAKMRELGLEIPSKYGDDFTYSQRVLDTVDKYFGKEQNIIANLGNDDIIKVKDTLIGRSLGAKAKNYDVEDPATGEIFNFVEGTKIQNSEIFAGYTTKKPLKEEVTHGLTEIYGGTESKWQHCKGNGVLDVYGEETRAEVHWFQEESVGKVKFKVKEWLE